MKFCNLCGRSHIDTLRGHAINYGQYLRRCPAWGSCRSIRHAINYGQYLRLKRERLMTNLLEDRGEGELRLREKLFSRIARALAGHKIQIPTS